MRSLIATALLITLASSSGAQQDQPPPSIHHSLGLVLAKEEGDRRVRRPRPEGAGAAAAASLIIKVDQANGGSPDFFMGFERIAAGAAVPTHRHHMYDEILFIHRGVGVATLDERDSRVREGSTIYIPAGTRVGLRNTGQAPLELLFIFPRPDVVSAYYNELTVREGEAVKPFTSAEFAAFRSRHRGHIEFD